MRKAEKFVLSALTAIIIAAIALFSAGALDAGTVSELKATQTSSSITLSWEKLPTASGYRIYEKISGRWKTLENTTEAAFTLSNLKAGSKHTYAVRAYCVENEETVLAKSFKMITTATRPGTVETVSATQTADSVTLSWTEAEGATGYRVYKYNPSAKSWSVVTEYTTEASATISGLSSGKKYILAVKPYFDTGRKKIWASRYTQLLTCTKPSAPSELTATAKTEEITLSWSKAAGATGYRVYKYNTSTKKWETVVRSISKTTATIKSLSAGRKYFFAVKPYLSMGDSTVWAGTYTKLLTCTKPYPPSKVTATAKSNEVTLSWSKVTGATGYRIYRYNSSTKKWSSVVTTKAREATIKKLSGNKAYIFAVRPYIRVDGNVVWGSYSKLSVKTKAYTAPHTHTYAVVSQTPSTLVKQGKRVEECSLCSAEKVTRLKLVDPATLDIPVVYINDYVKGEIPLVNLQKDDGEILVKYRYVSNSKSIESFDCFCEIKIQGASSARYPKKNFTVKFFEDSKAENKFKVNLGWGKENKYCMKANYIDSSQARNVVGARLFADIVKARDSIAPGLAAAPNYGLIDGYPTLVYVNGKFHGIYTMNIPKDDWMFGMEGGEEAREAMLMADKWTDSVRLYTPIDKTYVNSGWEVEHCSTENDAWVRKSFNKLIALLNCGDDARIKRELPDHLDIDAAIDNMLFTYYLSAADNLAKNILWVTYDGNVWIPSMYDMDGSFGIYWNGSPITTNYSVPSLNSAGQLTTGNRLYQVLIRLYADEVEARWTELRKSVLTAKNTNRHFDDFFSGIPDVAFTSESQKWTGIPYAQQNRTSMYNFTKQQTARLDAFFYSFNS